MDLQKTTTEPLPPHHIKEGIIPSADLFSAPPNPLGIRHREKNDVHITFPASISGGGACEYQGLIEEMVQGGLHQLQAGLPIVFCSSSDDGQSIIKVSCITESTPELMSCSPDLISALLPPEAIPSSFSISRILFTVDAFLSRSFLFIYNAVALERESPSYHPHQPLVANSLRKNGSCSLNAQTSLIRQQIILAIKQPAVYQQMVTALATIPQKSSPLLKDELTAALSRPSSSTPSAFLNELQRFLLAIDDDFHKLRTPSHLLKLPRSHLWLKEKHSHRSSTPGAEKWFYYRVFRSKLQFPFGTKDVICLVISLHSLSTYEQFDHRHILLACKRCIPSLEAVPRSFYVYRYSDSPALSLYLEVEKNDGSLPTSAEIATLKRELGQELSASIEQVMSRIDIPHNEEDLLRNFLLLSQQLRTAKDIPQVIVQFQGQTDTALEFHVTLVRSVKVGDEETPLPSFAISPITKGVPLRSSVIDTLRTKHVKQGIVFLVECHKDHFLRRDRSVDFLKARESVVHHIETAFGNVRDLNGGLIYQQHQLLESIKPLLTKEEEKELPRIENLFHSLSPTLMKNIIGPEHVVTVFRQFLALRRVIRHKATKNFLVEEYTKEVFIGFLCPPSFVKEEVFAAKQHFNLAENELALCDTTSDGHQFCFIIFLSQDHDVREKVTQWLQELLRDKKRTKEKKSLRLSLSRPIPSLDPRIGTDRMSGTVIKMLYEGLMRLDQSGNPTHAIAEEVLISDDGRTYTFTLRPTYWTNGNRVTAYDFEYAWKKILDPTFKTVFDYLLLPILNARLVKAGRLATDSLGIRAISDRVLIVDLEKPCPYFLELCCLWIYSPLCKDIDKNHPGWAYFGDRTYVCNGPFKLTKWSQNSGIQLEKNEHYWDKEKVSIKHIDIKVIEDPLVALQLFEQGELDWLGEPLSEMPLYLFKQRHPRVRTNPMAAVQWYDFNVQHPPFRSAKVRRALSYALNRPAIIKEHLYGDERASHSLLPPSLSLLDSQSPLDFDLKMAQKLFKEGMEEQGLTDSILKPLTMVVYDREPHKTIARAVINAWEKAFGLSFVLDVLSWNEFFERLGGTSHDILGHVWYSWYKDPIYSLGIFRSKTSSMNSSRWSGEEYARLLDKADLEMDTTTRNSLLKTAEEMLLHEMPVVPVFDYNSRYLKNEHVDNIYVSHLGNVDFKWTTFSQPCHATVEPSADDISLLHPPLLPTNEIRLYLQSTPISFDPRIGGDKRTQIITRELYEGLMRIGKDGNVEYGVAESVFISADQKIYTFHLRESLWSNGSELTADDFVWAIKAALSPSFSTSFSYAFFSIKNAQKASRGECSPDDIGIVARDKRTLEITLERPVPYFLELTSNPIYSPVCKSSATANPRWSSELFPKYVSNGPFILKAYSPKAHIVLEKNPLYWDSDGAKSERLSFRIIKDPQEALHMFELGELDWYGDPCGNMSREGYLINQSRNSLIQRQGGGTTLLACRTDIPHLQSLKIRKAIAHAINRAEICEAVLRTPAFSLLPSFMTQIGTKAFEDNAPETAVRLFEEGLAEIGMTKNTFPCLVITHWSDPTVKATVKIMQKQLKRVLNIQVVSCLLDWSTFLKRYSEGNFQMAMISWFAWCHDPVFTLQFIKHKNIGINGTAWENPEYIRLLELSDTTQDRVQRQEYFKQAEALVMNELPVIPIFYQMGSYAKAPDIIGEAVSPVGLMELKWLARTSQSSQAVPRKTNVSGGNR